MTASAPDSVADLQALVRDGKRVHVIGKGSKPALHCRAHDASLICICSAGMSGIIEYQPAEFTVTARAGTPVQELSSALKERGQYLPFDPLMPDTASIGGTVASNLSGSRRYRYGGIRDFILGAEVVDGLGRAYRVGGKVVKNSAGFDLSKFLVGSLGQYAIMTELTFKVFPDVPRFRNLSFSYQSLEDALNAVYFINQSVFELDALDLVPPALSQLNAGKKGERWQLLVRLGGFSDTLPQRVEGFTAAITGETAPIHTARLDDHAALWDPIAELTGEFLAKVVLSPKQLLQLDPLLADKPRRYSLGGNVAWVAADDIVALDAALKQLGMRGLCLRGTANSAIVGAAIDNVLAARVKQALDPHGKLV